MLEISERSVSVGGGVWKLRTDDLSLTVCQSLLSSFQLPVVLMVFIFAVLINSNFHRLDSKVSELRNTF
jgi:hypothetical protein